MIQYTLYIGLNDKDSKKQIVPLDEVINSLDFNLEAYTLIEAKGRYKYNDYRIQNENTLIVTIINVSENKIKELCNSLKWLLNQECIMVTKQDIDVQFK